MDDEANRALLDHGTALAEAIIAAVPGWVVRCVVQLGGPEDAARVAGQAAAADVAPKLRALLAADVDDQRVNPLAIVRDAVAHPTRVLRAAGVEPPRRSSFDEEHFPDDPYALVPMTWADVDESLHEPGIIWGALKARAHRSRHA